DLDAEDLFLKDDGTGVAADEVVDHLVPGLEDLLLVKAVLEPEAFHGLADDGFDLLLVFGDILRFPVSAPFGEDPVFERTSGAVAHAGKRLRRDRAKLHKKTARPAGEVPFSVA